MIQILLFCPLIMLQNVRYSTSTIWASFWVFSQSIFKTCGRTRHENCRLDCPAHKQSVFFSFPFCPYSINSEIIWARWKLTRKGKEEEAEVCDAQRVMHRTKRGKGQKIMSGRIYYCNHNIQWNSQGKKKIPITRKPIYRCLTGCPVYDACTVPYSTSLSMCGF